MSGLHAWLQREARRQAEQPDLLSALILGQGAAYARYRLGFVLFRLLLRTGLHTLEVLFLSRALPFEYLAPLLSYRALAALATTLHWGACEGLRARVRTCLQSRQPTAARRASEAWLGVSCALAIVPALFFGMRATAGSVGEGISLFDAYGLACALRLSFDVYARTYHAGVFAVRRVYRPLATLLASDTLEVVLIVGCFGALGAWCIPLAIVSAGLLDAGLGVHYARAAYRRHRMLSPRLRQAIAALRGVSLVDAAAALKGALVHSLANVTMQLDALLLLLLVQVDPPRRNALSFAVVYYVLRPLLGFATHWVRSFYFDLTRIEAGALRVWRPRLSRFLSRLALVCALCGAVLTLGLAGLLWPGLATTELLWLVPLFIARAAFALGQLQAFASGRYRGLIGVSAPLAVGLGLVAWFAHSGVYLLCGASLLLAVGAWCLRERDAGSESSQGEAAVLSLGAWLRELRGRDAVRVGVLNVARRSARIAGVMEALADVCPGMRLTRHARSHVLLLMPADAALTLPQLVAASGGTLASAWLSPSCRGVDSVGIARAQRALPSELHDALCPSTPERPDDRLLSEFRRNFPQGTLLDLIAGTGVIAPDKLPRELLADFMHQILAASRQREGDARERLPIELAVYAPAGCARLVFVVPRGTPGFAEFRTQVRTASLRESFYAAPESERVTPVVGAFGLAARFDRFMRP